MRMFAVCVVAVATIACSKSKPATTPPPPATPPAVTDPAVDPAAPPSATPSDAELDAMFAETLVFVDELATAADGNKGSCPAMATALTAVFDAHAPLLAKAKGLDGNQEVDQKADAYMEAHKAKIEGAMKKLQPAMQTCDGDADVAAAMARFDNM